MSELTAYDLDKMIAEGTVKDQHPIIQQLARQRPSWVEGSDTATVMVLTQSQVEAIDRLDSALCNFINGASDAFDPSKWIAETEEHFIELRKCYNECHELEIMDLREAKMRFK